MKDVISYPPGPSEILPYTSARQFLRDPIKMLIKLSTYGDISHLKFGKQHVYLLNNPRYIEEVLITNYKNFIKSKGLQISRRLLGNGLVTSEGEYHDKQRHLIQPTFYPKQIKIYGDVMLKYAQQTSDRWQDGTIIDIHKEMTKLTSAIICKAVLGYDANLEVDDVGDALLTCMEYFNRLLMPFGELIEKIPIFPINKGFQQAKKKLDTLVLNMIEQHRESIDKNIERNDLLYTLLEVQDQEAGIKKMTDEQLKDEVMTIFLAGHETTANTLTWTLYLLAEHQQIGLGLENELKSVLGTKKYLTMVDLPKLEYTKKIITESLRLYPPAWALGRQVIKDYKVEKYSIPAGSIILMSQYVMHRDKRYFYDPENFLPERWTDEFKKRLPKFSYFPFGGGIRGCIGEPFALMEAMIIIATIWRKWDMQLEPSQKIALKPLITLRPKYGMRMRISRR
jgi:cytochrome P450